MSPEEIQSIKNYYRNNYFRFKMSNHARQRMFERNFFWSEIKDVIMTGDVVEADDTVCCLFCKKIAGEILFVRVNTDGWIVTIFTGTKLRDYQDLRDFTWQSNLSEVFRA